MLTEHDRAIMEGEEIDAEDSYFSAKPNLNTREARLAFRAGFQRAWERKELQSEVGK